MGWLFTQGQTRSELIKRRTEIGENYTLIKHTTRGNVLWSVWKYKQQSGKEITFIGCDLMQVQRGYGWGYKDMDESSHPYYYSCPLSFLAIAPVVNEEWRKGVGLYHKKYTIGEKIELKRSDIPTLTIISTKPLCGTTEGGFTYRLRRNWLVQNQLAV
jgi:hypothetical protein